MVWSQLVELRTPPISTTDFLYLRFIGDRLKDKPFWIWNIQEHKRQNNRKRMELQSLYLTIKKFYSILVVLDTIGIFELKNQRELEQQNS